MAFLVLLESLSPVERAVFLLREVFGFEYEEIAAMIHKTEDNCRQIAVRARRHVEARRPRFEASRRQKDELAKRFFAAVGEGDLDGLKELLAADVVMVGDGGGKAPAIRTPGYDASRFRSGWLRSMVSLGPSCPTRAAAPSASSHWTSQTGRCRPSAGS
jgi:RNA polymerase sigma-70 factor (ECF subfamily)